MEHSINLKGRSDLLISGVEHIYSFSDKKVEIQTCEGLMVIDGEMPICLEAMESGTRGRCVVGRSLF